MPYKPKIHKPFSQKTYDKSYDKSYDKTRDQTPERKFIHSVRWRRIREKKLTQDFLCEICLKKGFEVPAMIVHHIDKDELNNTWENYQSVCKICHNQLHGKKNERP